MENEVVTVIIESIKVAAPLCAVLMSYFVWREQKRHQIEQATTNAQTQKDIAQLNAENNAGLKEREFELKFYEELIKLRLSDYNAAKKIIANLLVARQTFGFAELDEMIQALNEGLNQVFSLDQETFEVWQDTAAVLIKLHAKAIEAKDRDEFVLKKREDIQFYLSYVMSCINHGALSLNNLDKLRKDTGMRLKSIEKQGKEKKFLNPNMVHIWEEIEKSQSK
ncbi:MAG: hypothetical protein IV090_19825 [Candidatus Sericytochromatia bacterium]|nr:hypothetical protein [Candidatus Sericytochromatia bacterium]